MLVTILFLITGVIIGISTERISVLLKFEGRILTLEVYLSLFMIAIFTGLDEKIVRNLDSIGFFAFAVIVGAVMLGSIIFWYLYKTLVPKVSG